MPRVWNFSAGPAVLPEPVLKGIQDELLDYKGNGLSVLEMSHRSAIFSSIIKEAERSLRSLMSVPSNYQVLFIQGGGTLQFSMIPLNLNKGGKLGYVTTGVWASKAYQEAVNLGFDAVEIASSKDDDFCHIPTYEDVDFSEFDYIHITTNNTIRGTQYQEFPDTGDALLVADMSSDILSKEVDVEKFDVIYAGVQKNIGPAGATIVIIRDDLISENLVNVPGYLQYTNHAKKHSVYNTPPAFTIYAVGKVLDWLIELGGVSTISAVNDEKAKLLYQAIDNSSLFYNKVELDCRSKMNVPFTTGNSELDSRFIARAEEAGFINLAGHRTMGGMRASIYNAFPMAGVEELMTFMKKFEEDEQNNV